MEVAKQFLQFLVEQIVEHPESVEIELTTDEMGVLLSLKIHPEDMGRVIGNEGVTARSIRKLLRIVGMKHHARVFLKILEPVR